MFDFSLGCFPWVSFLKCCTHILSFGFVLLVQDRPLRFMDQHLQPDFNVLARPESTSFGFLNGLKKLKKDKTWMKAFCHSSHSPVPPPMEETCGGFAPCRLKECLT